MQFSDDKIGKYVFDSTRLLFVYQHKNYSAWTSRVSGYPLLFDDISVVIVVRCSRMITVSTHRIVIETLRAPLNASIIFSSKIAKLETIREFIIRLSEWKDCSSCPIRPYSRPYFEFRCQILTFVFWFSNILKRYADAWHQFKVLIIKTLVIKRIFRTVNSDI